MAGSVWLVAGEVVGAIMGEVGAITQAARDLADGRKGNDRDAYVSITDSAERIATRLAAGHGVPPKRLRVMVEDFGAVLVHIVDLSLGDFDGDGSPDGQKSRKGKRKARRILDAANLDRGLMP